jgi:DNA recombination protein RmuC
MMQALLFLVIGLVVGLGLGAAVGWLVANSRRAAAEARLDELGKQLQAQKRLLDEAERKLGDTFKALASDALRANNQDFIVQAQAAVGPLSDALARYERQISDIEAKREQAYGSLHNELQTVAATEQRLQQETMALVAALGTPQVRGRWGEMTLRRVVELAGLSPYCDFECQVTLATDDGRLRPDLVVNLPGDHAIVVDAKTPLDAYLAAMEAADDGARAEAMSRHAAQVRAQIQALGSRAYASQFPFAPDFVVLFLPGESFFSAALQQDRELIDLGIRSNVLLATPSTLIALLRGVAASWHQHQIVTNAKDIAEASHELFDRVRKFAEHLDRMHDGLERASKAFNDAVGSWQSRVLPQGRRVVELGGAAQGHDMAELEPVDVALRELPPPAPEEAP